MRGDGRRGALGAITGALLLASLAGCSPTAAPTAEPALHVAASSSGAPAPVTVDELDLSAEVYRTRSDPARGGVQLVVHNDGDTTLTIITAELQSPALAESWVRERRTVIAPGQARDLALLLGEPECPAESTAPIGALGVVLADGTIATVTLPTSDRLGQWAAWVDEQCFAAAVRERVQVTLRRELSLDAPGVIGAVLHIEGLTGASAVTISGVRGTVLLSLLATEADAARDESLSPGDPVAQRPLDVHVDEGRSVSIPIVMAPTRCDPHALADDKQGTLVPVDIVLATGGTSSAGERSGVVIVAADATTKAELYAAFVRACEL